MNVGSVNGGSSLFADYVILSRECSPSEIAALADPSNVMLKVGGTPLILPVWQRVYKSAAAAGNRRRRFLMACGA